MGNKANWNIVEATYENINVSNLNIHYKQYIEFEGSNKHG